MIIVVVAIAVVVTNRVDYYVDASDDGGAMEGRAKR